MDLEMNCIRGQGTDDDEAFSNTSRISCDLQKSQNSINNSDSECSGRPVSVRHMIQHYNNRVKQTDSNQLNRIKTYKVNTTHKRYHHPLQQHLLATPKSSYCGLNNYGCLGNCKQFSAQIDYDDDNQATNNCCMHCTSCLCCRNRSRNNSTTSHNMLSSTAASFTALQSNENSQKPNCNCNMQNNNNAIDCCIRSSNVNCNQINAKDTRILAVENCSNINDDADTANAIKTNPDVMNYFCTELKDSGNCLFNNQSSQAVVEQTKTRLQSTDSVEEANIYQQPAAAAVVETAETSYQSKTTIAKTSSGVRIIIDIFFDQERSAAGGSNIVGSRVETDIPQSHILHEFQKQTMTTNFDAAISSYQRLQEGGKS